MLGGHRRVRRRAHSGQGRTHLQPAHAPTTILAARTVQAPAFVSLVLHWLAILASTKVQILTQTTAQRLFAAAVGAEQQALQSDYLCCVRSRLLFFFVLFFFFLVFPLRQRSEPSSMLCKAIVLVSSVAVDNSSCFALRMCLSFASSSAVFELAYRQQVNVSRERERERARASERESAREREETDRQRDRKTERE